MIKISQLICFVLLLLSTNLKAQSFDWNYQTNDNIFNTELFSNKLILIHGIKGTTKTVRSKRISSDYYSITALDDITGEKQWEIKDPISMMALSAKEEGLGILNNLKIKPLKSNSNYFRIGRLLIVDSKDGTIIFNPVKEGITTVFSSELLPEGIVADISKNGQRSYMFLSFSSWKIEWIKKNTSKLENGKRFAVDFSAGKNDDIKLTKSLAKSLKRNAKIDNNYIVNIKKNKIASLNIETGTENWKYESKNSIVQQLVVKDEKTKRVILYLNTKTNRSKSIIVALDYETGNLLWEKKMKNRISKLTRIDESLSFLAFPATNVIGKRYYQIYNEKGQALLKEKKLKAFGHGVRKIVRNDNYLTIVTKSNQSSKGMAAFGSTFNKRGSGTKNNEFINVIDLDTKEFIFNERIKTGDKIKAVRPLKEGLFVLENNQVYIVNYKTKKKIKGAIKSKTKLIFNEYDENELYIIQEDAKSLHRVNKKLGEIKEIINLRKINSKISFISDLIFLENDILLYGIDKKDNLVIVKLDFKGNLIYDKRIPYSSLDYQRSWSMPIVKNKIYFMKELKDKKRNNAVGVFDINNGEILDNSFTYDIFLKEKLQRNSGKYLVNPKSGMIYHTPTIRVTSGFEKRRAEFNSKGIVVAKRFD